MEGCRGAGGVSRAWGSLQVIEGCGAQVGWERGCRGFYPRLRQSETARSGRSLRGVQVKGWPEPHSGILLLNLIIPFYSRGNH